MIIDEAQNLSDEAFEGLRLLLNFETYREKLLQIVLVGQPELDNRLRQPGLRQVADRIAIRCHLNPLTPGEARLYIEHRLRAALPVAMGSDADVFRAGMEIGGCLTLPRDVFARPGMAERILRIAEERGSTPLPAPSREQLVALAAG